MTQLHPTTPAPPCFDYGVFTLSLDFELIWGTLDKPKWRRFREICRIEREIVLDRLLALLVEYDISATWCTVGHLLLDRCECVSAGHPEAAVRDRSPSRLRLVRDPSTTESIDPLFYARSFVRKLMDSPTHQEIGSHTFSHVVMNDPSTSRQLAEIELIRSREAASTLGIEMTSFAFPRNRIGYVDLLPAHGFKAFRGQDRQWYEHVEQRNWTHRLGHAMDIVAQGAPPPVWPEWRPEGIWEIPGSMLYTPSFGSRRFVPVSSRVARATKGLDAAVRTGRIFHMWFHPTDLAIRHSAMLDGLRRIFDEISELRLKGKLRVLSMMEVVEQMERHPATVHRTAGVR